MSDKSPAQVLSQLAVVNPRAWREYVEVLRARREQIIKAILAGDEYGALRMEQGRLAEVERLLSEAAKVDSHLKGA